MNTNYEHIVHPFPPLYDEASKILILGSLPSVKSREQIFLWASAEPFLESDGCGITGGSPNQHRRKKKMLHENHIALWDTIYSCDIIGSSDSSIRNVTPTDLQPIIEQSQIKRVYCNGAISGKYFKKYQQNVLGMEAVTLPSTSPANAAYSVERLVSIWKQMLYNSL